MTLKEHCGVIGVYSLNGKPVGERIVKGLEALQHRGQESWGIAVNGEPILKGMGLISKGAEDNARQILTLKGNHGIGHVRYSTRGATTTSTSALAARSVRMTRSKTVRSPSGKASLGLPIRVLWPAAGMIAWSMVRIL